MEKFLDYFVPKNYELDLWIDKKRKTIDATEQIYGVVKNKTIKFHAVELDISKVIVDDVEVKYKYENDVLEISNMRPKKDVYIIIHYKTTLNENMQGAYLSTYKYKGKTETIVATQFESHYAREAFVCIDEPAAKAVFQLRITVPGRKDAVISNLPAINYNIFSKNGKTYVATIFHHTPPMSPYLLAFVIGEFNVVRGRTKDDVMVATYVPKNHPMRAGVYANDVAVKALEFYEDSFDVEYPFPKLSQVALPDFEAGAMENWGLITYRESMLLADRSATLATKKSVALTVAHEIAHQWFGNLVTMKWWDDLWLNESFASVMEYYAVDSIFPEYKIWEGFFTGDALSALRRDCIDGVQSVHQDVSDPEEIATLFDPAIVYAKGARLILMVIRLMGWSSFCEGICDYFEEHEFGSAVGDDLWDALNEYADFDVKKLMHAFIDKPGYPVVSDDGTGDFKKISQKRFLLDGEMSDSEWPIPEISEDMSGHYILNLSDAEFEERLSRFDSLDLEEKLRLLIDRDLVSKTSFCSSASLIPLVWKFRNETSAAVWSVILTIVSGLKIFFKSGSDEEKKYKKFVGDLVAPGISKVGLVAKKDDDENTLRLRSILLALDFYAENKENLEKLAKMYNKDLRSLNAETRSDILDAKLYLEPEFLDEYTKAYKNTADPEIKFDLLVAMTLMDDKKALLEVMKLLEQPEIVKPQDQFYLFIYLYRNPKVKEEVFEWLTSHWEYVKKISGDKSLDNYPRYTAGAIKVKEDFEKYLQFFEPLASEPALSRAIEMGKNEIEARLELIEADKKAVVEKLGEF